MYVRMVWGRLRLGTWDEYERYYNEHIDRVTREMPGFRGRQLLRSTENPDEGTSVTLWDTLEDIRNYDGSPQHQQAAREVEHLYTGEYSVRQYEIRSSFMDSEPAST